MDEIKELYKMNSYQTQLTEEIKNSVPREVWLELIDFLSSVEFIKRLVAPENVRGYAKDRPRETKFYNDGRVNVDLTNPHILEDMDFFRERALFYEKHGKYTHLTPNPNPKSEYGLFWKEELRRWKYGLIRPSDGEWIPGQLYFYWNYSPIWLVEIVKTENKGKKQKGERVRKFPKPWLGDYLFYHYMQQARDGGMHGKLLKTRGVGFSFKMGAISPCNMFVYPGSGNPNFHLASEKTFLAGDKGIWGKVVDTLDWIAESTPLPRMRTVDRAGSTLEIQLGFKDEYGVRKGLLSSVHGISLKDNPDKARGIRGPLIHYEEDGLFPNLEKAWNVNLKAVEDGDVGFGFMLAGGCLTKNNLIWTNDGRLLPINEITKEDGILGYDGNGIYKEKIGWFKEPQKKPCYKITTSGGDTIECSHDHPLLWSRNHWRKSITKNKVRNNTGKFVTFKNTEEIKIGDQLLLVDEVPIFGDRFVKDARMIGLMIGDGNYSIKATPQLSCGDDEIFEYVKERYKYTILKQFEKKTGGIYRSLGIPELKSILIEEGIYGQVHLNKKLPKDIYKYDKESLAKLIGGYFDADGDVYYNSKRNNVRVRLTSKSEDLLREVKYQLVKFGINSKITKEFRKTGYLPNTYIYRLNITSYTDVLRFKENIPLLIKHKNEYLSNILNHSGIDRTRVENGVFQLGKNNKGHFFIGKENMKNMRIESVTNIEFIGEQTIYNLHTMYTNTYIANNFITKQTGGVEGGSFEGSEKLFYNTAAYEIFGIPNVFDKNTKGDTTCGFFWGGYLNRNGCYDEECGEPDVIKALLQILTNRYKIKYNSQDPNAITQKKAEEPITPQEAIMRTEGTVFPVSDLKDYLESIMVKRDSFLAEHYVGELVRADDGKLKWRLNNDKFPLRSYDKDNANREGCLEIFEMPSENANGEIAHGRYIAGIDPIDADSGTSLFSIQVMDLFTDRIVAEFSGRPRLAEEAYEISLRLLEFYNAVANYEKNLKGLFSYFDKKNALFRLCDTPQILKDMQMTKDMGYGNTSKGTMANAEVNKWGRKLQADWMNTSLEDEENPGKLKLHTLRGLAYIEECIKWNSDGNFDRVSAAGMLFILREDRYKRTQSAIANKDKHIDTLANDKFFNRNFNKPNAMNGKQIYY